MDFRNFFIPYIFEVEKSISRSFTKLLCLGDLENPSQLPVSQVLEGTDDWVLWIFVISSFLTFPRSRNPFLAVSQNYYVWVTSKIQVNFRFRRCSRVLMIESYRFPNSFIPYIFEFKESVSRCYTKILCLGDLKNLNQLPVLHLLEGTGDVVYDKDRRYDN